MAAITHNSHINTNVPFLTLDLTHASRVESHQTLATPVGKNIKKNTSFYYYMTLFSLDAICSVFRLKHTYSCHHTGQYCTYLHHLQRTKNDCASAQCIFNWNTSVAGPKHRTINFPQRKALRRSTANTSHYLYQVLMRVNCNTILHWSSGWVQYSKCRVARVT
jgi:hypothetical protein